MGWTKGLLSGGGLTLGQFLEYYPAMFYPWSVAYNDYTIIQNSNSSDGEDNDINDFYFDLPYTSGTSIVYTLIAKFAVYDNVGAVVGNVGVRYKYSSEVAFGVTRLSAELELGYFDNNDNWVSMGSRSCGTYSESGELYNFKLRCHLCKGTTTGVQPFDFFGAVISIHATDRNKYVYAGVLDARQYVQGEMEESDGEFSPEFGDGSLPGGGYNDIPDNPHGTFDDSSDVIGIDAKPNVGVTTMGFVNVYKITQGQLQSLGEKLFPHFLPAEILADPSQLTTPETLVMLLKALYGTIVAPVGSTIELADNLGIIDILMNGKLIDYVIDCHAIPTSISDATVEGLKVGYRQFNDLQVAKATEDYVDVDCGSLNIGEYFANFLDFANVTCDLFLPFVGFVPIDSEYWNGGTLHVVYRFNIVDGSFQAKVMATSSKSKLTESIIGQYGGVACVHYPITGLQYSNVVAGLVNGSIGAVAHGSAGDVGGVATSLVNMAMLRPDNPMSNGYNASSSFLTHRTPYLVIKRPKAQFSTRYNKEMGLPLNVALTLSSVHGFTVIDNPVLNISCSDSEYQELVTLLKNGVILP